MPDITVTASTGRPTGSPSSRRLLGEGRIPGVVYGRGGDPVVISVERRDLRLALAGAAGTNALINLAIDGRRELALVKEMQRHPVKRTVVHVDFIRVDVHEDVTVEVPLVLEGEARAVAQRSGLVDLALNTITILAKPDHIPDSITIDISEMQIGDVIRVGDLVMPEGATTPLDPETAVVTAETTQDVDTEDAAEAAATEGGSETPEA